MISRRKFLKISAMAGAGLMLPIRFVGRGKAFAFAQSPLNIRKFVVPLPGLGPNGIPALTPNTARDPKTGMVTDFYSIQMAPFTQQLHPDLPETSLWGYSDAAKPVQRYLGGAIVAQKGRPVKLKVKNHLPNLHPLPVDNSIMGAEANQPVNRAAVHLHGGFTPWTSDGAPLAWFTPGNGPVGETFLNPVANEPGSAEYFYTNDQSARLVWYHDHAMGITRLNAYAGLASAYIIRDDVEKKLISSSVLPSNEIPLIIQDKTFVDGSDPNYSWGKRGDLWYPYLYEKNSQLDGKGRWDYGLDVAPPAGPLKELPAPVSLVPEFFSDTILVNGTCYPFLEVQPRNYRFRILNGSQARFYNLQLYYADDTGYEANLA